MRERERERESQRDTGRANICMMMMIAMPRPYLAWLCGMAVNSRLYRTSALRKKEEGRKGERDRGRAQIKQQRWGKRDWRFVQIEIES
jgi:hypothetical protein